MYAVAALNKTILITRGTLRYVAEGKSKLLRNVVLKTDEIMKITDANSNTETNWPEVDSIPIRRVISLIALFIV